MHIDPEHHVEPRKIGHKWFDLAITLCILFISLSSLIVAVEHSRTLERMADANAKLVETNSWPFLGYGTGNSGGTDHTAIEMRIANDGVGPAKIESMELKWNGVAQRGAHAFLHACCGYRYASSDNLWSDIAPGRVLRAGETITFLTLPRTVSDQGAWSRLDTARLSRSLSIDLCYCSVFDECWVEDVARLSLKPRQVDYCPTPAVPYGAPD